MGTQIRKVFGQGGALPRRSICNTSVHYEFLAIRIRPSATLYRVSQLAAGMLV